MAAMDMRLEVTDAVLTELAKVGFDPLFGARPLKRAIQSTLENPLAKEILEGRFGPKDTIAVDLQLAAEGFGLFAELLRIGGW